MQVSFKFRFISTVTNVKIGAVTLDVLPMGNLAVTAWVGFTLGYVRLPVCGYTCKLPKGMVSVDLFWRETYLHVNMEDLNDELFFGLISVIVTALLLNRPLQLSSAIQRFILRRQRRRRLQSRFLQSLQLSHFYFRRRLAAAQTDIHFCTEQR